MGVTTSAYAIPARGFRWLIDTTERLDALFGYEGTLDPTELGLPQGGKPETYHFDKLWEERIIILHACGYRKAGALLDGAREVDHPNVWVRYLKPTAVRTVARVLAPATAAELTQTALARGVTDYYGEPIIPEMYDYLIGDIERVTAFFQKAADAGDYVLLASA
jgi:hypothetical protein